MIPIFFLSGCSLEPRYCLPCPEVPEGWKRSQKSTTSRTTSYPVCESWWEAFEDPVLTSLEEKALENNKELEASLQKIFEARAIAGVQGSSLYPQVNLKPLYSSTGALVRIFGLPSSFPSLLRIHELIYALPLNLSYEVDFWGKLRNQYRSAMRDAQAKEFACQTLTLMLTAELASNYFQIRALDTQLELLAQTIAIRRDFLDIVKERYRGGWVTVIDQTRAESLLYEEEASYSQVLRQRALLENAIAVLIGEPAPSFCLGSNPLENVPPVIPPGLPSQILLQRPDIQEAERLAAAENAAIGSARAAFFPSLKLTGLYGSESPDLKNFLKWQSRLWSLNAYGDEAIFNGYQNISNLDYSWARFQEASALYQQRVLVAFKEVEDALANLQFYADEMEKLEKAGDSAKVASEVAATLYAHGQSNYLDVADSEREYVEVRRRIVESLGKRYMATVYLIKAIGGYWSSEFITD